MVFASGKTNNKSGKNARDATVYIVRIAFMAAMLTAFKFALSFIPNVEVVTLMICVYGSAMGIAYALPATLVFCTVEIAIYGVGSWVLLYYVYWTLLAVVSSLFLKGGRAPLAIAIGVVGSVAFGVLSACCDTLFCVASLAPARLGDYLIAYYIRGLYFDVVHTISNAVILSVLYVPLVTVTKRVAPTLYARARFKKAMRPYLMTEYARESFADEEKEV
ncbi:MAG: hypothetical protein NC037_04935 [Bacteroides sp.]|nr:hypothetical protein [Bacillota bacterium]MCM1394074.1 hypothetical protein [[Eubacterium] siraeum]MCM1455856.1 hypothetical protein [Bacteroides sp.]